MGKIFNIAGPCNPERHYMLPATARVPNVMRLIEDMSYFVVHAQRQCGKTTAFRALVDDINATGERLAMYCSLAARRLHFAAEGTRLPRIVRAHRHAEYPRLQGEDEDLHEGPSLERQDRPSCRLLNPTMREIVNSRELKSAVEDCRSMCFNFARTLLAVVCCAGLMPFASSAESLRVGTWNIRLSDMDRWDKHAGAPNWRERMPSVAAALKARNCDLVGLQECSTPQAEFLRAELPDWRLVGVATNDTVRRKTSQANGVLYRPGRLDLLDWGTFSLSDRPDVPGSMAWNTRCVRSCTWALFKDRGSGRRIMHFNTHFDHKSEEARREGMKLVLRKMDELTPTGAVRILTGDLNSPPDSESIARARAKLRRTYEITETPPKGPWRTDNLWKTLPPDENLTSRETGKRIDHIFVSDGVRVRSHETFVDFASPGFYASDHFMLAVELVLPAESCNSTK